MTSFRKKVFISFFVPLALFLAITIPIANESVDHIVFRSMNNRADEVIEKVQKAKNNAELIQILKNQRYQHFYRIGVFNNKQRLLYDTHTKHLLGPFFESLQYKAQPEVEQAAKEGIGYLEAYSRVLDKKLVYLAKRFDFHGKSYIIRLAFPHQYIAELKSNFAIGFLAFSSAVLVLFSITSGLILNFFTQPIKKILAAIRPYQQGTSDTIQKISLKTGPKDAWTHLANTINSLSEKVQNHIETLTSERNEKASILEALAEGVLAVDEHMTISYANSMAMYLLDLEEYHIGAAFPKKQEPHCFMLLEKAYNEQKLLNDAIESTKGTKTFYLNVVASPRIGRKGAILVLQDKSIHYRTLEMRKTFIANASHELKTPITIIRGFAETLHDHTGLPHHTTQEVLGKIVSSCERMTKIISDLLTLADVENLPQSRLEHVDLTTLLHTCKKKAQALRPKAKISFIQDTEEPFILFGDKELVEVACSNLLENAVKYCDKDPVVEVHLKKTEKHTQIIVSDNGLGIPKQDIDNVFDRFYTVDKARSKKLGGSGLGLSIVKTIMEKHMGSVALTSDIGKGSTFTLTFPNDLETQLQKSE